MATSTLGSGTLVLAGTTSGTTTVTATAVAGTTTLTLPAATDTLVGKATTDTLTNKTLTGAAMNGTVGATTPSTGAFTTMSATTGAAVGGATAGAGGLAFPATAVAVADANTLDDYEEGEWTPTDASGAALTITPSNGKYTKIGRVVYFQFKVTYPTTANTANAIIGGLPFTVNNNDRDNIPVNVLSSGTAVSGLVNQNDTTFNIYTIGTFTAVTNATLSTRTLRGSGWYVAA